MFVEITGWVNAVNASFMKASCQMFSISVSGVLSSGRLHFLEFREVGKKKEKATNKLIRKYSKQFTVLVRKSVVQDAI